VPDRPVIPFIRRRHRSGHLGGSVRVFDAAVEKAYGGKKKISWFEVFAGQTAKDKFDSWLPDDPVRSVPRILIGIKAAEPLRSAAAFSFAQRRLRSFSIFLCLRAGPYFKASPRPLNIRRRSTCDLPRKHGGQFRRD